MADPDDVDGWLRLVSSHESAARMLADDRNVAMQGWWHAGLAIECALKAYIMRRERLNGWPSREARPELFTHDLRALRTIAGIKLSHKDLTAAAWHVALQWDRNQGYDPKPMPRRVARSMVSAAFDENGVVTWIRQKLK